MSDDKRSARWAWLAVAGLSAFLLLFAVGCGDSDSDDGGAAADEAITEVGKGEGELNIIAWAGYAEDGSTDPKVDWVTDFEKETGCQTNVKIGNTSDEMVTLMRTGQYDGVSASGDATLRLIEGGDVDPVNTDLVVELRRHLPRAQGPALQQRRRADVRDSARSRRQPPDVQQGRGQPGSDVAERGLRPRRGIEVRGSVTAYDSPIYIADAALYLMETEPDLGITNPYELDQEQFDAAIDLLKQQNENVGEYWADYTKEISAFTNGDSKIGTTWQVINQLLQGDGQPVEAVLPDEGSTGWSDTWMVSSEAEHPNCMYMWMKHITDPKVNAEVAEWFGEAPANAKACDETAVKDHCEIYDADGAQYLDDLYYWTTPLSDCGDDRGDVCMTYDDWVQGWTEVKG